MEVWSEEFLEEIKIDPTQSEEDLKNETKPNALELLTLKSKKYYEAIYNTFMDWRSTNGLRAICEETLLQYFKELSENRKSSSLWKLYSILRSTLKVQHDVNLETYTELRSFLKNKAEGYQATPSKAFTPDEICKFINEAPDNNYLSTKVALILGIIGACHRNELHALTIDDIEDHGSAVQIVIPNVRNKGYRKFIISGQFYKIFKKYVDLRPCNAVPSLFLNYQKGKCTERNIGLNKFGAMAKQLANFLKLPNPELYTAHSFWKSSTTLVAYDDGDIIVVKKPQHY